MNIVDHELLEQLRRICAAFEGTDEAPVFCRHIERLAQWGSDSLQIAILGLTEQDEQECVQLVCGEQVHDAADEHGVIRVGPFEVQRGENESVASSVLLASPTAPLDDREFQWAWLEHVHVVLVAGRGDNFLSQEARELLRGALDLAPLVIPVVLGRFEEAPPWIVDADNWLPRCYDARVVLGALQEVRAIAVGRRAREALCAVSEFYSLDACAPAHTRDDVALAAEDISKRLEKRGRRAALPSGPLQSAIDEALEDLDSSDLAESEGVKSIRLSIERETLDPIREELVHIACDEIRQDIQSIDAEFIRFCDAPLEIDSPGWLDELREELRERAELSVRYRGERPKRGVFARISEGRRQVYMVLMTLSLFGGAIGFDRASTSVTWILAALFFGSILHTFSTWRRQDAEQLDKELERARDAIASETRRFVSEFTRERAARVRDRVRAWTRELERRLAAKRDDPLADFGERVDELDKVLVASIERSIECLTEPE